MPERLTPKQFPIRLNEAGKEVTNFGYEVALDLYDGFGDVLGNEVEIANFLNKLVDMLGMEKLGDAQVYVAGDTGNGKDRGGVSAAQIISEKPIDPSTLGRQVIGNVPLKGSHVAFHSFGPQRCASLNIYSCNDFRKLIPSIELYIKETLGFRNIKKRGMTRLTEFPMHEVESRNRDSQ